MISIIIPTLNEASYIERSLQSIKNQSAENIEIIVIDGGSSDNTVEIAGQYADLVMVERSNIAAARNLGAKHARGGVLIFLDADSTIAPDFALKIEEFFSASGIAAAYGKMVPFEEEMTVGLRALTFIGYRLVPKISLLLGSYIISGPCMVVSKSAFDAVKGFREDLDTAEDLDLYRRLAPYGIVQSDALIFSTSMRRFSKGGLFCWLFKWVTNYFYYLLTGKTGLKKEEYVAFR